MSSKNDAPSYVVAEKIRVAALPTDPFSPPVWYVIDLLATVTPAALLSGEEASCDHGVILRPHACSEIGDQSDASDTVGNGAVTPGG